MISLCDENTAPSYKHLWQRHSPTESAKRVTCLPFPQYGERKGWNGVSSVASQCWNKMLETLTPWRRRKTGTLARSKKNAAEGIANSSAVPVHTQCCFGHSEYGFFGLIFNKNGLDCPPYSGNARTGVKSESCVEKMPSWDPSNNMIIYFKHVNLGQTMARRFTHFGNRIMNSMNGALSRTPVIPFDLPVARLLATSTSLIWFCIRYRPVAIMMMVFRRSIILWG